MPVAMMLWPKLLATFFSFFLCHATKVGRILNKKQNVLENMLTHTKLHVNRIDLAHCTWAHRRSSAGHLGGGAQQHKMFCADASAGAAAWRRLTIQAENGKN